MTKAATTEARPMETKIAPDIPAVRDRARDGALAGREAVPINEGCRALREHITEDHPRVTREARFARPRRPRRGGFLMFPMLV